MNAIMEFANLHPVASSALGTLIFIGLIFSAVLVLLAAEDAQFEDDWKYWD